MLGFTGHIDLYFLEKILKKWNQILEFGCIFLFKILISYIKIMYSVTARTCYGFREHMYHGENFEKMTQYDEFGCIFLHNYAFKISHFLYKVKYNYMYIVSVEGSSIVLLIECLWGMFLREFF